MGTACMVGKYFLLLSIQYHQYLARLIRFPVTVLEIPLHALILRTLSLFNLAAEAVFLSDTATVRSRENAAASVSALKRQTPQRQRPEVAKLEACPMKTLTGPAAN